MINLLPFVLTIFFLLLLKSKEMFDKLTLPLSGAFVGPPVAAEAPSLKELKLLHNTRMGL